MPIYLLTQKHISGTFLSGREGITMTLEEIQENMRIKNMTVAALSRNTGLAYSTVYDIVHGNTDLTKCACETVEKLNAALTLGEYEELIDLMTRESVFEEHFMAGPYDGGKSQKEADKLSRFFMGLMMATFASANIPVNTRLDPILDVKTEDIDFAKGERTFFCLLEDAYFDNWITKEDFERILWKAYKKIESLDTDIDQKFPRAKYKEGFCNICNAAYYMDDLICLPQITQTVKMEDTERWKEVRKITKDTPLIMVRGFDIAACYKTEVFQDLFNFLLTEKYNPKHAKEQRDELYCMDVFRGDAQEFIRRLSMASMDTLKPIGCMENAFVFWWKENDVLLHAACVETGRGAYFTEAADDSISYDISIHDRRKHNNLFGYMPREAIEQRSGFEDTCSPYMEELLHSFKCESWCTSFEFAWELVSDAPRTKLRTYLFSIAERIAKKDGPVKAAEWMDCAFSIWQYARLFPEDIQVLVEEYLHIQQDILTEDMELLEETLFTCAAVPNKNKRTKKWHAQTIDNEESEIAFSTKKDALLYIKDRQRNLRAQLQGALGSGGEG